jgi:glycosyltransferase involved in cell wall biosynthesis
VRENGWDSDQGGTIDLNKLHYINNGIDLSEFNVNMQRYKIEDFDLANDKTFNIIYLGSIRLANNLKLLIVGLGNTGYTTARVAIGFGMQVYALTSKSHFQLPPEYPKNRNPCC